MRPARRFVVLIGLGAALWFPAATPATAHPAIPGSPRVRVVIEAMDPPSAGDVVRLAADDQRAEFTLEVAPGHEVIVLGYTDEPYLKVDAAGRVWADRSSSSWVVNSGAGGEPAVPSSAGQDPSGWWPTGETGATTWHDHRIHWMNGPNVPSEAATSGVLSSWTLRMSLDGQPVSARGTVRLDPGVSGARLGPFERQRVWSIAPLILVVLTVTGWSLLGAAGRQRDRGRRARAGAPPMERPSAGALIGWAQ